MKKVSIVIALVIASFISYSQEFMGIKVGGTSQECVNAFKKKGFSVVKVYDDLVQMEGIVNGENYELNIVTTPISKKVWKFSVYLEEKSTWLALKRHYQNTKEALKNKYGEPKGDFESFTKPYYEGDGYEMSAVALEKVSYGTFWDNIAVYISKYKQVCIQYENPVNTELKKQEQKEIESKTF